MKTVRFIVDFINQNGEIEYAVSFTGVMTRRNIYAKRISTTGALDYIEYVKAPRADTKDTTSSWRSMWDVTYREIEIPTDLDLHNSRIVINPQIPDDIIKAIESAVAEESSLHKEALARHEI